MMLAKVKWYNKIKGYGYLIVDGFDSDVMVHQSAIQMEGFRFLKPNQPVIVTGILMTDNGLRAEGVKVSL